MIEAQQFGHQAPTQTATQTHGHLDDSTKRQEVYQWASKLYDQEPDWVTFFREVLGINGVVRRHYPDAQALVEFEKCEEYQQIQQMLAKLRSNRFLG